MNVKYCTTCKILKPFSDFQKHNKGINGSCRKCCVLYQKNYYRSKKGLITDIYRAQRYACRLRNHAYPTYSLLELREWVFSQTNFDSLFDNWANSNYEKSLRPSCDRLNAYKSYSFDNLRLVTWGENKLKGHNDRRNGINTKTLSPVKQLTKSGVLVDVFPSGAIAARALHVDRSSIYRCCDGKRKSASGFKWERV